MNKFEDLIISESEYPLEGGEKKGKIAVFIYTGNLNPTIVLEEAVRLYSKGKECHRLVDANLDNPWMRVVVSDINDMYQRPFNYENDKISTPVTQYGQKAN